MTRLCACGCGKPTPLAVRTRADRGQVMGQPIPFLRGHGSPPKPPVELRRSRPSAEFEAAAEMYRAGMSSVRIVQETGIPSSTLWRALHRLGIEARSNGGGRPPEVRDFADAVEMYRDGARLRDIAERYGMNRDSVRSRLVELGVEIRSTKAHLHSAREKAAAMKHAARAAASEDDDEIDDMPIIRRIVPAEPDPRIKEICRANPLQAWASGVEV